MKSFSKEEVLAVAQFLWQGRYHGAEFCIAAGSIIRGEGTVGSDLDLVVIYPKLPHAYRESFYVDGLPVEAFVHDFETIQAFMDADYKNNSNTMMHMLATGIVIPKETENAKKLRHYANEILTKGRAPLDKDTLANRLYFISDAIDDLRGERSPEEIRAILCDLYHKIGALALWQKGSFVSEGKHLARKLIKFCPDILQVLEDALRAGHNNEFGKAHLQNLEGVLKTLGGPVFDGYRQDAPEAMRSKAKWLAQND